IMAAHRFTSAASSRYVYVVSFSTSVEIHTSAFWSPRVARWRSSALWQRFVSPPTNHLANGGREESRTLPNGWGQSTSFACSAQKPSRSATERAWNARYVSPAMMRSSSWRPVTRPAVCSARGHVDDDSAANPRLQKVVEDLG